MNKAPITYDANFFFEHQKDHYFDVLWNGLPWEQREGAPRRECWTNPYGQSYTYGTGDYARTYEAHQLVLWSDNEAISLIEGIMLHLNEAWDTQFDCCFVNGYEHGRQHLGWHADDSPEMDMEHQIAVVSFGAEREIWFRTLDDDEYVPRWLEPEKMLLEHGSVLMMGRGMQRNWQHRIPKSSVQDCGPRLSLTYRKLVR